jgi:hypothetical protein
VKYNALTALTNMSLHTELKIVVYLFSINIPPLFVNLIDNLTS